VGFVIFLKYFTILHMKYITWCQLLIYVVHLPFYLIVLGFLSLPSISVPHTWWLGLKHQSSCTLGNLPTTTHCSNHPWWLTSSYTKWQYPSSTNFLPNQRLQILSFQHLVDPCSSILPFLSKPAPPLNMPSYILIPKLFIALIFCCTHSYEAKSCLYIIAW